MILTNSNNKKKRIFLYVFYVILEKVEKKYSDLRGDLMLVELERGDYGLGLSLAGNKDRSRMNVFIVGLHPNGNAAKDGTVRIGDEVLEVSFIPLKGP